MPIDDQQRADLVAASVPTLALFAAGALLIAAWIGAHVLKGRVPSRAAGIAFFAARVAIGTAALWMLWQGFGRVLVLASSWPLWVNALIGAAAIEVAIAAYHWERQVVSRRKGQLLLGLRLAAIATVLFILVQPVFARDVDRKLEREVVVLLDDSESMQLVDRESTPTEKLALADFYGVAVAGDRPKLASEIERTQDLAQDLEARRSALAAATGGGSVAAPAGAVEEMAAFAEQAAATAREVAASLEEVRRSRPEASGEPGQMLGEVEAILRDRVAGALDQAGDALSAGNANGAMAQLSSASEAAGEAVRRLPTAQARVDAAFYERLAPEGRDAIDGMAALTRAEIARETLVRDYGGDSLVDLLRDRYKLRFVRFARSAAEIQPGEIIEGSGGEGIDPSARDASPNALLADGAPLRYLIPDSGGVPENWTAPDFDDSDWTAGAAGIGFDGEGRWTSLIRTDVAGSMKGKAPSLLVRIPFRVGDPSAVGSVVLRARYDDGFAAFINGEEVARRNAPDGDLQGQANAQSDRSDDLAADFESIDLPDGPARLRPGENILAVHVLNRSRESSDVLFAPELTASLREEGEAGAAAVAAPEEVFRSETDIVGALEEAADKAAPDSLAGVLLLSDGQHNADRRVEDIARRLGVQGSPVGAVAIGSSVGPADASILDLQVPESIYLGDKIVARADVKLDGLRGRKVTARLVRDGEELDTLDIDVPDDSFRTTLRFRHVPADKGIFSYSVRIDPVEGERFRENNSWIFDVAVTDDRKNVLLVDSVPRWEFRYLRNLFYARDKSVHLQYVLLDPETVAGAQARPAVAASAARPFGDAEATQLPDSREEWLKFDAIILGDVSPDDFDASLWETIEECVSDRGALLVLIAGPRSMPHAFADETFGELAPVRYRHDPTGDFFSPPEERYRLALTPEGRASDIMRQSPSSVVNGEIWQSIPDFFWRHPIEGVKEGADVLAYAERENPYGQAPAPAVGQASLASLMEQREEQRRHALIAVHRYALGSVAMLSFDRTWRLRYGVGDTYHHRFWGQLLRWGSGENLRAGTEFVRVGTDQLSYDPEEPVKIVAKVVNSDYRPVLDDDVRIAVYRDGEQILSEKLRYRESSNGIYETEIPALGTQGRYRVALEGDRASEILAEDGVTELDTEFLVATSANPVELAELNVNLDFLNRAASLSGGDVVEPMAAASLIPLFGEPSRTITERIETTLWDKLPILLLFIAIVTAEWIVRRQGGLV